MTLTPLWDELRGSTLSHLSATHRSRLQVLTRPNSRPERVPSGETCRSLLFLALIKRADGVTISHTEVSLGIPWGVIFLLVVMLIIYLIVHSPPC
jgi:hypothetical protein